MTSLLLFILVALSFTAINGYQYKPKQTGCERITIPLCSDMRYNYTRMPNLLGHVTQQEAAAQVHEFIPLVQVGCSKLLKFFLCAEYAPMCTEQVDDVLVIPPCRAMCDKVRSLCEPVLLRFNFHWPPALDCELLPTRSTREDLCIEPPGQDDQFPGDDDLELTLNQQDIGGRHSDWMKMMEGFDEEGWDPSTTPAHSNHCPHRFAPVEASTPAHHSPDSPGDDVIECLSRCRGDVIFRSDDKAFAVTWMVVWAGLSLTSSVITVVTFFMDSSRFTYPERPVVYISICSAIYASGYLVRAVVGRELISCDRDTSTHLVRTNIHNVWCSVIATVLYYCSVAGATWWAVLTVSWYLAAARKWSEEAISSVSKYFHLLSWIIPLIATSVALALHRVSADELTGLCFIGAATTTTTTTSARSTGLVEFTVVPLVASLVVGVCFVAAGFGAVYRIRRTVQREGGSVERLERLMVKMAVFSVLYALPLACVLGCLLYEHRGTGGWYQTARTTPCSHRNRLDRSLQECSLDESIPAVEVYLVKIFMSLMPGIASGVWIWSMKTVRTWHRRLVDCDCTTSRHGKDGSSYRRSGGRQQGGRLVRWSAGFRDTSSYQPPFTVS